MFDDEEGNGTYYIPRNYTQEDTVLNGKINVRRVLEACMIGGFIWALENNLLKGASFMTLFILFLCLGVPLCALALLGISGYPLSTFLFIYFDFQKNKRKFHFKRIKKRIKPKERSVKNGSTKEKERSR